MSPAPLPTCPPNSSYLASPEFISTGCHIVSVFMIITSSYSAFLIVRKSTPTMKSTVPYMIRAHLCTMFCDFTWGILVIPMMFWSVVCGYTLGISKYFINSKNILMYFGVWLMLAVLAMIAAILHLFEFRHQAVVSNNSKFVMRRPWTRRIFYFSSYTLFTNFGILEVLTLPSDQDAAKLQVLQKYPCLPSYFLDDRAFLIQIDGRTMFNPHMYITCFIVACFIIFYMSNSFWHLLPKNNPTMSTSTRKLITSFYISMCIQFLIPLNVGYIPNIYWNFSVTIDYYSQEINNISVVLLTSHCTLSSIVTIFIYTPYRKFTLDLIFNKILQINWVKSSVSTVVVSVARSNTNVIS